MKLAIMQPYLFPYIGYFQLINVVDEFVIYDNIEFTKKGWINRNRILVNGIDSYISLPLKKDSDYLDVNQRYLSEIWTTEKFKILNKIKEAYRKAPFFKHGYPLIEKAIVFEESNLFLFILNSLQIILEYLDIKTPLIVSSNIIIEQALKSQNRVMAICKSRGANSYLNPIGGLELYDKNEFKDNGIELGFIRTEVKPYNQFDNIFVPSLSIIDVIMFNSVQDIKMMLSSYVIE
jgi:WbqC-like protein family